MIEIDKNERIVRTVRKHWLVLVGDVFILIFAIAMPVILLVAGHYLPIENILTFIGPAWQVGGFFLFLWLTAVWMFGFLLWTDYYLDVLIVTDKRVFDIQQHGLFRRESSAFRIDRIQNITVEVKGVLQTFLDFGTIRIETAGEREDFIANYISHPYEIKKFLNECQDIAADESQAVHFARAMPAAGTPTPPQSQSTHPSDPSIA